MGTENQQNEKVIETVFLKYIHCITKCINIKI
jgi:hypothetical protein